MPDQLAEAVENDLDALGHLQILDPDSLPRASLDASSLLSFRARHRRRLEAALLELEGAPPMPGVLTVRGRVHWLLGRGRQSRRDLRKALALEPRPARAAAYLGVALMKTTPAAAVRILMRAASEAPSWGWPRLWLAAARLKLHHPTQARRALEDLEQGLLRVPDARFVVSILRASAYLRLGRYQELAVEAEKLIGAAASGGAGYGARAAARLALGDLDGAFSDHDEMRNRNPDCGFDVAEACLRRRAGRSGREFLAGLTNELRSHPARACFYAARAEMRRGPHFSQYDAALEDYRRAEALEPDSAWLQAQMARAEGPSAGPRAVLKRLDRAAALRPDAGWIYAWRGEAKRLLGRDEEALADFERCLRRMPWYSYAYAWKGALLARLGRWSEACEVLTAALDLAPTEPTLSLVFYQRSLCRRALGRTLGAVEDATAAFRGNGRYEWAAEGAPGGGIKELNALLAANPRQAWVRAWRGRLLMRRGNFAAAAVDFSKALAFQPSNVWFLTWRGMSLRELGRAPAARSDFVRASRLSRGRSPSALYLAEMKFEQGKGSEALRLVDGSGDSGTDAPFFMRKARLFLQLGKQEEALASMKRAASLSASYARAYRSVVGVLTGRPDSRVAAARMAPL